MDETNPNNDQTIVERIDKKCGDALAIPLMVEQGSMVTEQKADSGNSASKIMAEPDIDNNGLKTEFINSVPEQTIQTCNNNIQQLIEYSNNGIEHTIETWDNRTQQLIKSCENVCRQNSGHCGNVVSQIPEPSDGIAPQIGDSFIRYSDINVQMTNSFNIEITVDNLYDSLMNIDEEAIDEILEIIDGAVKANHFSALTEQLEQENDNYNPSEEADGGCKRLKRTSKKRLQIDFSTSCGFKNFLRVYCRKNSDKPCREILQCAKEAYTNLSPSSQYRYRTMNRRKRNPSPRRAQSKPKCPCLCESDSENN